MQLLRSRKAAWRRVCWHLVRVRERQEGYVVKGKVKKNSDEIATLDRIKRLAVVAMFSDDDLLDEVVLKGGNASAIRCCMSGMGRSSSIPLQVPWPSSPRMRRRGHPR